ncbi:MAG: nitroreductase family protein [Clostridia bacterium]|nr:nitroreductase family protein [Clostridia bacterium]
MDFLQLAKKRYSTRSFSDRPVSQDDLMLILEAGRVAPTAANRQPQRMVVIQSKEGLEQLGQAARLYGAPLAILVCADHRESWKRRSDGKDSADIDASIVTTHLMMQATDLGLSTLWICAFDPEKVRKQCRLPDSTEPINLLAIGYDAGPAKPADRHATERKPLCELVVFEHY